MIVNQARTALTCAERHMLRQQWVLSGQCARCFHASRRQLASEDAYIKTISIKAPESKPTRQARAANISEQVQRLAEEQPAKISKPANDTVEGVEAEISSSPNVRGNAIIERAETQSANRRSAKTISSPKNIAYRPRQYNKAELLTHGHNTATLAAQNYTGVIADRISTVVDVGVSDLERTDPKITHRLKNQEVVRFESAEQIDRIQAEIPQAIETTLLGKEQQRRLGEKLVAGYYTSPVASTSKDLRQRTLASTENLTRLNGTYHDDDVERIMAAVKKLLPVATPAATTRKSSS